MNYSKKIESLATSMTLALSTKAKNLIQEGIPVLDLTAGEPDFDTPEYIRMAGIEAINKGLTRYTPANGTLELRTEICKKLLNFNKLEYSPNDIIVSTGAKQSLLNALMAICNPGDEVLIPTPFWVSYPEMTKIASGVPITVETSYDNDFKVTVSDLDKYLTNKSKVLIINNPSNPTGAVYSKNELMDIANWALKNKIFIISDEIYERLNFVSQHHSIASFNKQIKNITITIGGFSKSYAMTGWRLGYCAANGDLVKLMNKIQSHATSCANSIAQYAGYIALKEEQNEIEDMITQFKNRSNLVYNLINDSGTLDMIKPQGAFYGFINIKYFIGKKYNDLEIKNASDLANILLDKFQVAILPGIAFGNDNYIRISYATDEDTIRKALERLIDLSKKVN
ncbi:pyridoxal phosphate-dependent aminotransferase [Miniphocaeibacter halophilus]|uniref:Pyridoxal phosphate-dependent aminotransferase n=1 Tax=Miniphocaeibacter halophilus TaxID=2931922 RepID=A0AC61N0E5_9FIRM|nr:pyridoxal phosphate-dependent aminotransferase [Miniphocaeibacter halophilus]QQK07613.1 pyridoxal phosphate-dependent aminotransferase [Miniphocaeibacter halophilus]